MSADGPEPLPDECPYCNRADFHFLTTHFADCPESPYVIPDGQTSGEEWVLAGIVRQYIDSDAFSVPGYFKSSRVRNKPFFEYLNTNQIGRGIKHLAKRDDHPYDITLWGGSHSNVWHVTYEDENE